MTDADRILTASRRPEDLDAALRPKTLDEFVGQRAARENLRVFIDAARRRGDALDVYTVWSTARASTPLSV